MGNNNTQLQFTLKAIDEASAQINAVKEAVSKLQTGVDSASASMSKAGEQMDKTKTAHESMTGSVFKGTAAWDLLKKGIELVSGFVEESIRKSLEQQKTLDLVQRTVQSMGMSFEKAQPQLEAFGNRMEKLGVDGEDAQLSAAKLAKMAGGDLAKGMELAKLASDLASSGMGDLSSNTEALAKILGGHGALAAREFNLQLSQNATTGEILNAIQKKVTQTTEEYAETVPGKIKTVQQAYDSLLETVGGGFVTALSAATTGTNDLNFVSTAMEKTGKGLAFVVFEITSGFILFGKAMHVAYEEAKQVVVGIQAVGSALSGDFAKGQKDFQEATNNVNAAQDSLHKTLSDMAHPFQAMEAAAKANTEALTKYHATLGNVGDGIKNTNAAAVKDLVPHAEAVKQLTAAYHDMMSKTSTDLATMSDDHVKNMDTIQKSITATQKAITDLTKSYNQGTTDDTAKMADEIIASQQKISDYKKQLASTDDTIKKADIQSKLDAEQNSLDASTQFQKDNAAAITEAKRRAGLTQMQRDLEDYKNRRALAATEYNAKLADLNQQLADEQSKQAQEMALYKQRQDKITEFTAAATADFINASNSRIQQTKDEVNAEIQAYAALASAISAVRTASASAVTSYTVPNFGGKREAGGPVQNGTTYLVGEKGPELFTASMSGAIIPNNQLGGVGGGINVTITGNTISSNLDVSNLAKKVGEEIMRTLRLNQKISI